MLRTWAVLGVLAAWGCAPEESVLDPDDESVPRECRAPAGVSARPTSIEEAMALIDALPGPTTLSCFIQSLERPLTVFATASEASAQPAVGDRSPRIFFVSPTLIMSITPEGIGTGDLEFSEPIGDRLSIKGELTFPVREPLSLRSPFEGIDADGASTCGVCHARERRVSRYDLAYASEMLQPDPDTHLSAALVRQYASGCDESVEPERCALLSAIFDHGEVLPGHLPEESIICRPP